MTHTIPNFRLTSALDFASRGWHVFPIYCPKLSPSKPPSCSCPLGANCTNKGKHPLTSNGLKDATTDEAQIRAWWGQWPAANVGIVTGAVSGIVVLDVDPRHGGDVSLATMMDTFGEFAETVEASTGGGGMHLLFMHPGSRFPNSNGDTGWLFKATSLSGLDVRGDGGYIVAPPSLHASGERYGWKRGADPGESQLAAVPAWFLNLYAKSKEPAQRSQTHTSSSSEDGRYWLGKALARTTAEGTRNDTGYWLAQQLRDAGLSENEAESLMLDYADRTPRGDTPYSRHEAVASMRSAYACPKREPARGKSLPVPAPRAIAKPTGGAATELREYLDDIVGGRVVNVPWPWPMLTRLTQALIPGTVTTVVGDPGVGKTFFVLQCLLFWRQMNFDPAVFFIEKDRRFHMMRLLAQLEGDGRLVDFDWIPKNGGAVATAMQRHHDLVDAIGKAVVSSDGKPVSLPDLQAWVRQQASAGRRLIIIDPVTAAEAGPERWNADRTFMLGCEDVMAKHGASLVLITHPKKGNRPGATTGHDTAGGAAYFQFCDTLLWLNKPKKARRVQIRTPNGPSMITPHLFYQIHKARHGRGSGAELAYLFGEGLKFAEQGYVTGDADDPNESLVDAVRAHIPVVASVRDPFSTPEFS